MSRLDEARRKLLYRYDQRGTDSRYFHDDLADFERLVREDERRLTVEACAQIVPPIIQRRQWQNNPQGILGCVNEELARTGDVIMREIRALAVAKEPAPHKWPTIRNKAEVLEIRLARAESELEILKAENQRLRQKGSE